MILNLADDAIVADSVRPETSKNIALQGVPQDARVIQGRDSIAQKVRDPTGYLLVQLGKIFLCGVFNLNQPSQDRAPLLPGSGCGCDQLSSRQDGSRQ